MSEHNPQQKEALGRMMVEGFRKGDAEIVAGCLKRGADPDVPVQDDDSGARRPVLHWAAYYFNEKGMQAMLDHGADIEARDDEGETALMCAIRRYKPEAVEFLMRHGANPVAQNHAGVVALDLARTLSANHPSYRAAREKIIKSLTADYGAAAPQLQLQPETLPPPVTFGQKPKGHKFSV